MCELNSPEKLLPNPGNTVFLFFEREVPLVANPSESLEIPAFSQPAGRPPVMNDRKSFCDLKIYMTTPGDD
jgi:hypothetical protein